LALNVVFTDQAQQARGYTLATLLSAASMLLWLDLLETPRRWSWLAYGLAAGLAVYAHSFAFLIIAAQWASLAVRRRNEIPWRQVTAAGVLFAGLSGPLVIRLRHAGASQISWIHPLTLRYLVTVVGNVFGLGIPVVAAAGVGLAVLGSSDRRAGRSRATGRWALLVAWLIVPVALAIVISFHQSILLARYFIVVVPAVTVLAGVGFDWAWRQWRVSTTLALVLIVAMSAISLRSHVYIHRSVQDWRGAWAAVRPFVGSADQLAVKVPNDARSLAYYVAPHHGLPGDPSSDRISAAPFTALISLPQPCLWMFGDPSVETADTRALDAAYVPVARLRRSGVEAVLFQSRSSQATGWRCNHPSAA
jgi:hypothetical protein